jgi:hypothetical protein
MSETLILFLQQDLGLSSEQITFALRQIQQAPHQLPMILWQYGMVNIQQLDRIFDWLETA